MRFRTAFSKDMKIIRVFCDDYQVAFIKPKHPKAGDLQELRRLISSEDSRTAPPTKTVQQLMVALTALKVIGACNEQDLAKYCAKVDGIAMEAIAAIENS